MPFYEYACQACGEEFETLQKISEPPLTDCPACKKPALRKKISAAGFRLKGGGWYETDFKSGNKRNVVDAGKGESQKSDQAPKSDSSSESGKKETKSAVTAAAAD